MKLSIRLDNKHIIIYRYIQIIHTQLVNIPHIQYHMLFRLTRLGGFFSNELKHVITEIS